MNSLWMIRCIDSMNLFLRLNINLILRIVVGNNLDVIVLNRLFMMIRAIES